MDPAFLLFARHCVISWIKIRNQYTAVASQDFMHNVGLAGFSQSENDMLPISKNPPIPIGSLYIDLCFVHMYIRTFEHVTNNQILRFNATAGHVFDTFYDCRRVHVFTKYL